MKTEEKVAFLAEMIEDFNAHGCPGKADTDKGLHYAREIIDSLHHCEKPEEGAVYLITALSFKAIVAMEAGCHADAADCPCFESCYVWTHAAAANPSRSIVSLVSKGRRCEMGNVECSLNLDNPGRRHRESESLLDVDKAMAESYVPESGAAW